MSNALALAATSAVLQSLLNEVFLQVKNQFGLVVNVSSKAPDIVQTAQTTSPSLLVNLFLHQVTPNAAWRNVQLPSLAADGSTRLRNQPLALDLHYLLTAYGVNDFEAEALLGYAIQMLHETPVLARDDIKTMLNPTLNPPPAVGTVTLNQAGLADQIEMLKITPATLGREEVAWLWTALKADYRPTFPFQVSVVLIQAEHTGVSPLPVLRRHIRAQPDVTSPLPALVAVNPPGNQPTAKPGDLVTVTGANLQGTTEVVLANARLGISQGITVSNAANGSFQFTLPNPAPLPNPPPPPNPQDLPAGVYLLTAQIQAGTDVLDSNSLPFAAAPTITVPPASPITPDAQGNATVTITCAPYLRPGQAAALLIGDQSAPATTITEPSNSLSFLFNPLRSASTPQLVRLRVDGVESQIIEMVMTMNKLTPVFSGPTVTVN